MLASCHCIWEQYLWPVFSSSHCQKKRRAERQNWWQSFCLFEFLSGEWGLGSSILSVPNIRTFESDGGAVLVLKELYNISLQRRKHGEEKRLWTLEHSGWDLMLTLPPSKSPKDSIFLIKFSLIKCTRQCVLTDSLLCGDIIALLAVFLTVFNTALQSPVPLLAGCLRANYSNWDFLISLTGLLGQLSPESRLSSLNAIALAIRCCAHLYSTLSQSARE